MSSLTEVSQGRGGEIERKSVCSRLKGGRSKVVEGSRRA